MKNRKGALTVKILESILDGTAITANIVVGILESGYGASYKTLRRNVEQRLNNWDADMSDSIHKETQKIYSTLARLKKSGCLDFINQEWKITKSGQVKHEKLSRQIIKYLPEFKYDIKKSNSVKIFTFDIPESRKKERNWLRANLINFGFTMLQKSVWIGKITIPEEFIDTIKRLELQNFIEIITINKTGNIKEINL